MLRALEPGQLAWRAQTPAAPRCGYADPRYVASLQEFGTLVSLPRAEAWVLARPIGDTGYRDAIGAYPVFTCDDFAELIAEICELDDEPVSVSLVPDLFSALARERLDAMFDIVLPFKTHYLVDLEVPFGRYLHRHHRRYATRSFSQVAVERAADPAAYASDWAELYRNLVARHALAGIRAFSSKALAQQLQVGGCHYFRAIHGDEAVGGFVCYLDRGVAYAHLISTTPLGQKLMVQYALYWTAIEYFRSYAKWFEMGGVAGLVDDAGSGLGFFKRGWATAQCPAYFCGKILHPERYRRLTEATGPGAAHFPAYRASVLE